MTCSISFLLFLYLCSHISSTRKNENNLKIKKLDNNTKNIEWEHFNKEQNARCFSSTQITFVKELFCSRNYRGKFLIRKL